MARIERSLAGCSALVVFAALAGLFVWRPVQAVTGDRLLTLVYPMPSVGVAPRDVLQVNVANVSRAERDPNRSALVVTARLVDARGAEIVRSQSETLPHGATFRWAIGHAALAGAGTDERGRIQVRAEVAVEGIPRVGAFVPSLELVDEPTGEGSGVIGDIRTVISAQSAYASANTGLFPQ
jgi:hypothetical protein